MTTKNSLVKPSASNAKPSKTGLVATSDADTEQSFFDDKDVALNVKSARQNKNLTMEQLSALTRRIDPDGKGVSRVSLSRYENGESLPGLRELRLISFATRRPLSFLVYRKKIDPMSSYKLELEMRILDTVMNETTAEGLIKQVDEQLPEEEENYQKLLKEIKGS